MMPPAFFWIFKKQITLKTLCIFKWYTCSRKILATSARKLILKNRNVFTLDHLISTNSQDIFTISYRFSNKNAMLSKIIEGANHYG